MSVLLRVLLALIALLVLAAAVVFLSLRPPAPLPVPAQGATLAGVQLVEPGLSRRPNQTLRIAGSRIASIGPASADPGGDYAGMTVLPGLVDMHAHMPPPSGLGSTEHFAFLFLAHGVTSIRHAGDIDGTTLEPIRTAFAEARFPAPRVFGCGPFVDGPEKIWANTRQVLDPAEAEQVVDEIAAEYDCLKAYDTLSPEVALAIHRAALVRGLPVIGHVPYGSSFEEAQLDDAQHLMGIASVRGEPAPFPRNLVAWRNVSDGRLAEVVASAAARGMAITPTLVVLDRLAAMEDHAAAAREADALLVPRYYRDLVWAQDPELGPEVYADVRAALERELELTALFHEAGVELHLGTDVLVGFVVPGASLHRELRLFERAGFTPEGALTIATRTNAAYLSDEGLGRLMVGAPADLVVFREDPTRDLAALDTLEAVVSDGRLYTRADIDEQLARYASHHDGLLFDRISVAIIRRVLDRVYEERDGD